MLVFMLIQIAGYGKRSCTQKSIHETVTRTEHNCQLHPPTCLPAVMAGPRCRQGFSAVSHLTLCG